MGGVHHVQKDDDRLIRDCSGGPSFTDNGIGPWRPWISRRRVSWRRRLPSRRIPRRWLPRRGTWHWSRSGFGRSLWRIRLPYGYGYPYGYGSYALVDGGCYLVRRRVMTPYGWRLHDSLSNAALKTIFKSGSRKSSSAALNF